MRLAQFLHRRALAADDDARLGREDGDDHLIGKALDVDLGHARLTDLAANERAQLKVFGQQLGVLLALLGIPARLPIVDDA